MSQITDAQLRSACQDRCAEFGDPPCYELSAYEGEPFNPCKDCLLDCGATPPPEPQDHNAAVGALI